MFQPTQELTDIWLTEFAEQQKVYPYDLDSVVMDWLREAESHQSIGQQGDQIREWLDGDTDHQVEIVVRPGEERAAVCSEGAGINTASVKEVIEPVYEEIYMSDVEEGDYDNELLLKPYVTDKEAFMLKISAKQKKESQ